jgi:catechol 2,3-dioxygenase-like lactoylglutathione lyase family enzyme
MEMVAPLEVGIGCNDLYRMIRFYRDALGCELVSVTDMPRDAVKDLPLAAAGYKVARLQTPLGERIKFLQPYAERRTEPGSEDLLLRDRAFFLTFIVANIDAALDQVSAAGAGFLMRDGKVEARPGFHLVFVTDPEGNVIELSQYDDITQYRPDAAQPARRAPQGRHSV